MNVRILEGDIHLIDLETRLPFKYGIATMTRAPQAFVRIVAQIDGREATGVAADLLPPRWFTKDPAQSLDQEIAGMLDVIEHAVAAAVDVAGESVFEVWLQLAARQRAWARERRLPPLLYQFGTSLVERALIEAYCRHAEQSFAACLRAGALGIRLDHFDPRLAGHKPGDLLPAEPLLNVTARHTVGMADSLAASEIDPAERRHDGLPQSLDECIDRYGLTHFKLKLSGEAAKDVDRLARIAAVLAAKVRGSYAFSLDGNESFRSLAEFQEYWLVIRRAPDLARFLERMLFVEQPFHRDVALDRDCLSELVHWAERPPLIIDESDAETDSLAQALALGYHGTSHKNCKGVFKGVANACLLELLRRSTPNSRFIMSGEDLANVGPVALLQDLAVVASLGVQSVERNGHHYFTGLAAFPANVQEQVLAHHGDLYDRSPAGWPTLRVAGGNLDLSSIVAAPLGVGFELDVTQFTPAPRWRAAHLPTEIQP